MNIKILSFVLVFCIQFPGLYGQDGLRKIDNSTFGSGEFLKYRVHYGLITAGFATLEVAKNTIIVGKRPCYHITMKNYTSPTFDVFYRVRDKYESYFDQDALLSWRFNRHIEEGNFTSYSETHFDHKNRKARYIDNKKQVSYYPIPNNIQDIISAFYFARTRYDVDKLKTGDQISLQNFIDRKTVALKAKLLKREQIKVEGKKFKALKFSLNVQESGMLTDNSKIEFWISDDKNKIPIRVKSDLPIGSLKADLMDYKNLLHPVTSLKQ